MMYDKAQCKILFQIIRVSLFDSDEFEINAEADWKLIYRISREHKIHTILCRGLEKISSKDKIPEKMIGKLVQKFLNKWTIFIFCSILFSSNQKEH